MKIKTSDLQGAALDWAVAKCEGITQFGAPDYRTEAAEFLLMHDCDPDLQYATNWSRGGPLIEREWICVGRDAGDSQWGASIPSRDPSEMSHGPTPLIAAMRCYVASRLGDEVEVPDELVENRHD